MTPRYPDGIPEPRRRGRPEVPEQRASVSTWVPATLHDRLIQQANAQNVSVSTFVRNVLILRLK